MNTIGWVEIDGRHGLTVMALAPHSVANLGISLWALGFPLATPVRYTSALFPSHLTSSKKGYVVCREPKENGTYEFNGQWNYH